VLRERVAARQRAGGDASEADLQVLARQLQAWEPLTTHEQAQTLTLRTLPRVPPCDR
jgi:predicted kinase